MPAGSVSGRVVSVGLIDSKGDSYHSLNADYKDILSTIKRFSNEKQILTLRLDNYVVFRLDQDLKLEIGSGESSKIKRRSLIEATIFGMKEDAFPSRSNQSSSFIWAAARHDSNEIRKVLRYFSEMQVRGNLLLNFEETGYEISIYSSLKPEIPAMYEFGAEKFNYDAQLNWDIHLNIWPMLEVWMGIQETPKVCPNCGGSGFLKSSMSKSRFAALDWLSVDGEVCNNCRGNHKSLQS